jgi:hypothetical protein
VPLVLENPEEYRVCRLRKTPGEHMKSIAILPLALVLATTCAIGQDTLTHTGGSQAALTWSHRSVDAAHCPVGLEANHGGFFIERNVQEDRGPWAYGDVPPAALNQRIHLTMTNLLAQDIVDAQITVRGLSDKWRVVPLANASDAPDLRKTIDVALVVKGNRSASRDLALSRFTAVTAIDVNSVTYADGSSWKASSPGACSIAPDPFMLVSAAR